MTRFFLMTFKRQNNDLDPDRKAQAEIYVARRIPENVISPCRGDIWNLPKWEESLWNPCHREFIIYAKKNTSSPGTLTPIEMSSLLTSMMRRTLKSLNICAGVPLFFCSRLTPSSSACCCSSPDVFSPAQINRKTSESTSAAPISPRSFKVEVNTLSTSSSPLLVIKWMALRALDKHAVMAYGSWFRAYRCWTMMYFSWNM